jgi:hypothetical protein
VSVFVFVFVHYLSAVIFLVLVCGGAESNMLGRCRSESYNSGLCVGRNVSVFVIVFVHCLSAVMSLVLLCGGAEGNALRPCKESESYSSSS